MMIKKFKEYIKENTATTSTVGSGTAVGGGAEGSFTSSAGQAVYGGDSGTAFATNSNTAGMGDITSPQPSDIPGDVSGSVAGSGDIGHSIGTYSKSSPKKKKKKKKTKSKKDRDYIKKASVIDKYYTTKYTEKYEDGKIITKWETFNEIKMNENIFGNISRLKTGDRPETKNKIAGRMQDDNYAVDIYNDMIKDFQKYNKDLRKVKLVDGHMLIYVFGEYDKITNSTMSGNIRVGNKKIIVNYNAPNILINRNELEKAFGIKPGIKFGKGNIKIEEVKKNPNYNPNYNTSVYDYHDLSYSEREMLRKYNIIDEQFAISYDLARDFVNYFNKEYDKQYPELKKTKTKNEWSIKQIEKGEKPTLGYVDVRDKNNKKIIYPFYDVKDKKKIENYIKNHEVAKGRNKKYFPITYFLDDTEKLEDIYNSMDEMDQKEIDKQNLERVKKYN